MVVPAHDRRQPTRASLPLATGSYSFVSSACNGPPGALLCWLAELTTRRLEGLMPRPVVRSQRRDQIVRAAVRLVRERGVQGFTTADVADEAGVSRGILHYHFDSKDEIVHEALLLVL